MTPRSKRLLAAGLALALPLMFSACGDDEPSGADGTPSPTETDTEEPTPEPTDSESEEPEVVRADADLVIWADETRAPVIEPFAEAFGEENNITIAVQQIDFGQMRQRVGVAGPAGEGPDIFMGAHDWLGELVANGVVEALDLGDRAAGFEDVAVQAMTFDGKVYGLPYAIENIALLRNTELVPEAPATWEAMMATAMELKDAGTIDVPMAVQWADPFHEYPLVTAFGGYVFGRDDQGDYDPDDLGIDSEGGLAAAAAMETWIADGFIDPNVTYDVMIESFGTGKAPFAITGPWAIAQGDTGFKATGVPYVVEPIPPIEGGEPQPFVGVQGFMVSSFAPSKLLATTFVLDFMSTEEAQLDMYEAGGRPPALTSAFEKAKADPDIAGFGEAGKNGYPMPAIPEMGHVWQAWTDAYTLIGQGEDGQKAFQDAAAQVRTLIAEG